MKIRLTENDIKYMINEVLNELMMNEANLVLTEPVKGEPVCMYIGRFQPFHNGHLSCIKEVAKKYGMKTFILPTHGNGKPDKPIMGGLQDEMWGKIKTIPEIRKFAAKIEYADGAAIDKNVKIIRENGFEPVLWVTGSDHEIAYGRMANNEEYKRLLKLVPSFRLEILDRDPDSDDVDGVSGSKLREAIIEGNEKEFQRMTPKELWGMFDKFRAALVR